MATRHEMHHVYTPRIVEYIVNIQDIKGMRVACEMNRLLSWFVFKFTTVLSLHMLMSQRQTLDHIKSLSVLYETWYNIRVIRPLIKACTTFRIRPIVKCVWINCVDVI